MTGAEVLLACLVCLMALIFWKLHSNGNHQRQRPVGENKYKGNGDEQQPSQHTDKKAYASVDRTTQEEQTPPILKKSTEDRENKDNENGDERRSPQHIDKNVYASEDITIQEQHLILNKSTDDSRTGSHHPASTSQQQAQHASKQQLDSAMDAPDDKDEEGTDIDRASRRQDTFSALLQKLGMNDKGKLKITLSDSMRINSMHVPGNKKDSVIETFVAKLASYDYRVQQIKINVVENAKKTSEGAEENNSDDWTVSTEDDDIISCHDTTYCSRDILYAIFISSDPFFLQEVLMKLSACQIAVPVLLPDITGSTVHFLLWGLRKIVKSWCCNKESSSIKEETIVRHKMLTVTALRIGEIPISKSNVLNKLLGSSQGNDEHAFFMSVEQDSHPVFLSEGILECVWFLPGTEVGPISSPFALLNLRGDYLQHKSQGEFAIGMAFLTIIFMDADYIKSYKHLVDNIRSKSHVIVVCCQNSLQRKSRKTGSASRTFKNANFQLTQIFSHGLSALEISAEISQVIKDLFCKGDELTASSLDAAISSAKTLNIVIDEAHKDCKDAKQLALEIFNTIKDLSPDKYKEQHFKLQKHWQKWSEDGNNKSWNSTSENLEKEKAKHEQKQKQTRLDQADLELSHHLQKVCSFLIKSDKKKRDYFLSWLKIYLNDISTEFVKPLTKQLMEKSSERRALSNEINNMEKTMQNSSSDKTEGNDLKNIKKREEQIAKDEKQLIQQFDDRSLGVEHFYREFGQLVESYLYTNTRKSINAEYIDNLPCIAAEMLLDGHPLEILDGDVSEVPILWLGKVLAALVKLIKKDATVYVISVLGIQSSGKSTLLNSMFGVRFAASAGRCTRGVFMQLLPIKGEVRKELNCEYLVIVDTEGLRAPEKSLSSYTHQDNELATFALCISNLTLINIGGQTMGEDMTNVLQIAAHAFVRMTQVDLKPECRIIQQFVADVTADQKNESAMQTILMKLDEAAREAAKKEGKEHLYRQFSDVFSVQNYSSDAANVQYIPSLWRGFMGAPDYQYSLRVQQLKSAILQSIRKTNSSPLTLTEFHQRISDVWNAIKKEDFVFSFQNTKEVTLYQEVTYFYKDLIQPIRQELIEIELSAISSIENAKAEEIDDIIDKNLSEIRELLQERCKDVCEKLKLKCNEKKYESVRKYSTYFETDLQVLQGRIENSIRSTFSRHASIAKSAHKKDSVLQSLSEEIHDKFAEFAHTLRKQTEELLGGGNADDVNKTVNTKFKTEWKRMMEELNERFPLRSLPEITDEIKTKILRNLKDVVLNSDLSMEALDLLAGDICLCTAESIEMSSDHIESLKSLFSSIEEKSEKSFEKLFKEVKDTAQSVRNFEINTPIVLEKIKTFINATKFIINEHFILLYMCSQFLMLAHKAQQKEELTIVSKSSSALSEICREMKVLEQHQIKPALIAFIMGALPEGKNTDSFKTELEECPDNITATDEEKTKQTMWGRFLQTVHWSDDTSKVFSNLGNKIKNELAILLERNNGKCSAEVVKKFATSLVNHCLKTKIHGMDKLTVLKHFFKLGEITFQETFYRCVQAHVNSSEYEIRFAEPRKLSSLQTKLDFLLTRVNGVFSPDQCQFLRKELKIDDILKVDTLPHVYSLLQRIDFRFLKMLPKMNTRDIVSVTSIVDKVKTLILTTAQPKATFYEDSFARHVQDIFQTTKHILENKVRAAAMVHVGAWALPIYARRQFDFEREKNIAILIQNDKKMFETEFKSLASNCQDEMIAERFVEIIEHNLKDGYMNILYPMIYASISNEHSEFRMKKTFIGYVLKDLFNEKQISGIAHFLCSFTQNSLMWILNFVAKKIKNNPRWLENLMTQCIMSLVKATTLTILEVSDQFKHTSGDCFSPMLDYFVLRYKINTKLTCKNADIEKLKRYLNVNDINTFLLKCTGLFDNLEEILKEHFRLPPFSNEREITTWLTKSLPKMIHVDLFDSIKGCEQQCPFCRTVCDESLCDHPKHEALCHVPSGLTGSRDFYSNKLNTFICNSAVESELSYRRSEGNPEWRLIKEYAKDFPDWSIRPEKSSEPRVFWKYVFAKYNEKFAQIHNRIKADIPEEWNDIDEEQALKSLFDTYNLNE